MYSVTRNALSLFKGTGFLTEAFTRLSLRAGVPTWHRPVACQEPDRTTGGERQAREPSSLGFTAAPPGSRPRLSSVRSGAASESRRSERPAANCACEGSECALFRKTIQKPSLPTPWENVGFRETRPWCQKLGDPLLRALSWEFWWAVY